MRPVKGWQKAAVLAGLTVGLWAVIIALIVIVTQVVGAIR